MAKYKLYTYEVWGNTRDGYEINNIHPALFSNQILNDGSPSILHASEVIIDIDPDNFTSLQIARKLKTTNVKWDYDHCTESEYIYGYNRRNGKPIGELRPCEENI